MYLPAYIYLWRALVGVTDLEEARRQVAFHSENDRINLLAECKRLIPLLENSTGKTDWSTQQFPAATTKR